MRAKKFICLALAAALTLCMAACSFSSPQTAMTIEGMEIPAGLYLIAQYEAYLRAVSQLSDKSADVLTAEIEEKKGADWIHDYTLDTLKRYVYTEKTFDEQGLSFTDEERSAMDTESAQVFSYNEAIFTANGIGEESYRKLYENSKKYEKLLTAYQEDPANSIPDDEAKAYMDETYVRVQVLSLPVTGSDYKALPEDKADLVRQKAQAVNEELKGGKTLDDVAQAALEEVFGICEREWADTLLSNYLVKMFLSRESTGYTEEFLTAFFNAKIGDSEIDESSGLPMIYQKIANYTDDADFAENWREPVTEEIASQAFVDMVDGLIEAYSVQENGSAMRAYNPSKIRTTVS